MRGSCALTQDGMSLLGHILDLHARHGAIMALEMPVRKRAVIGMSAFLQRVGVVTGNRAPLRRTALITAAL